VKLGDSEWLVQLVSDKSGHLSSTRASALLASASLCFSLVALSIGSFWHQEMLATVAVLAPSVATLATVGYAMNRWATKEKTDA
jgi:hypothetical protein